MTTDNERRCSPRVPCHDVWLSIKVSDQSGPPPNQHSPFRQVRVDNISGSGICLLSAEPLDLGQTVYFFDSNLPPQGTVVWTCLSKLEYKVGIQFTP